MNMRVDQVIMCVYFRTYQLGMVCALSPHQANKVCVISHCMLQGVKNDPIKNRYISNCNYDWKMIDISFESELLKFLIVCRFLLLVTNYDHDKS